MTFLVLLLAGALGFAFARVQGHYSDKGHLLGWALAFPPTVAVWAFWHDSVLGVLVGMMWTWCLARAWLRWHARREMAARR